jgi:hypothetical protein
MMRRSKGLTRTCNLNAVCICSFHFSGLCGGCCPYFLLPKSRLLSKQPYKIFTRTVGYLENTRMVKCVDVRSDNGLALKHYILLVIIAVAERHATDGDAGQGIHNIADSDIGPDTTHVDHSVHGQGLTTVVNAVDARGAGGVCILPYAEAVVDEGVVHTRRWGRLGLLKRPT